MYQYPFILDEILYYENFNLEDLVTPVNADRLQSLLEETNFDKHKTTKLINGFRNGFEIGYSGNRLVKLQSPNLKFTIGDHIQLWNKVMKEVKEKRYAGPFDKIPFDNYIQSPIGLVPKDGGKATRLIFHLSYPRKINGIPVKLSVNANTSTKLTSVKYPDFSEAIKLCLQVGVGAKIGKSDLKSAFRQLCIRKQDWCLLVMKAVDPRDGRVKYFVDKCLPFGASISCAHFQLFSDALSHIIRTKSGHANVNYLDDFLFAAVLKLICDQTMQLFINTCRYINFPISLEKTFWGTTSLTFLGLLIDTQRQLILLPVEKIEKARYLIEIMLAKKKSTVAQIQQLCGILNFFSKCIIPARVFTRRLYAMTAGTTKMMKPDHHISLKWDVRMDLELWLTFLNNSGIYARSFADFTNAIPATELDLFTDASANKNYGCGGVFQTEWYIIQWDPAFIVKNQPSINYLELYAVAVAVVSWAHHFKNQKIALFCDNMSVVSMINNTTSMCKNCMILLRIIVLHGMLHNVTITAKHVAGVQNKFADALSRQKMNVFKQLSNGKHKASPIAIPDLLWPMEKVWMNK